MLSLPFSWRQILQEKNMEDLRISVGRRQTEKVFRHLIKEHLNKVQKLMICVAGWALCRHQMKQKLSTSHPVTMGLLTFHEYPRI